MFIYQRCGAEVALEMNQKLYLFIRYKESVERPLCRFQNDYLQEGTEIVKGFHLRSKNSKYNCHIFARAIRWLPMCEKKLKNEHEIFLFAIFRFFSFLTAEHTEIQSLYRLRALTVLNFTFRTPELLWY